MKLRITQAGFENYSGQMGMILFKNGLSVEDVKERDALRLSALFGCTWEHGEQVKITKQEVEMSAPVGRSTFLATETGDPKPVGGHDGKALVMETQVDKNEIRVAKRYTLEELESIVDDKGIEGLREIANPLGIRGKSINVLIESIMNVAGKTIEYPEGVEIVED